MVCRSSKSIQTLNGPFQFGIDKLETGRLYFGRGNSGAFQHFHTHFTQCQLERKFRHLHGDGAAIGHMLGQYIGQAPDW